MKNLLKKLKRFYFRYENHLSSVSLISGFIFDILTLKRVDQFWENLWVGTHLLIAAIGISLLNYYEKRNVEENNKLLYAFLIVIIQFAFGGLFSTFIVFYFRSSTLAASWPFLLILAANLIGNEIFKKRYSRLGFQINVFFIAVFSFAIFIVPVVMHRIGNDVFLISGAVSLVFLGIFILFLRFITDEKFKQSHAKKKIIISIAGVYLTINALYFTNLIPPIPLSLKDAGVYYDIKKVNGVYSGQSEVLSKNNDLVTYIYDTVNSFLRSYGQINLIQGNDLYVYTAVFSPAQFNTNLIHDWQYLDTKTNKWVSQTKIILPTYGGREGGYRTYSKLNNLQSGLWRVDVTTEKGQVIGRIRFEIINTAPDINNLRYNTI